MRVKIGKYVDWFGPYQLADALCFWVPKVKDEYGIEDKPDWVHDFGEWLTYGDIEPEPEVGQIYSWDATNRKTTWLSELLSWIHSKKERKVKIQIDPWDTWNMEHTLALIILPMLKQLKAEKHGACYVALEDVPEHLRYTETELHDRQDCFEFYHEDGPKVDCSVFERWDWVLDEMIFAFEHVVNSDWQDDFHTGEHDIQWKKLDNGCSQMIHGPNDTYKCDYDGMAKVQERINNGLRLFGKYYQNLWD